MGPDRRTPRRHLVPLAAAVVALVVAATACLPVYSGNPAGRRVAVIGDSITVDSFATLHRALDPTYQVAVNAGNNLTIGERFPTVADYFALPNPPEILVVALGTNDANNAGYGSRVFTDPAYLDQTLYDSSLGIWRMLSVAKGARCIVLVDVSTHTDRAGLNHWARAWNGTFLPGFAGAYPQVRYASWDQAVGSFGTGITRDTIHPNDWGKVVFAVVVANAIATCP